jgi:DNA-directed RNA polymerase subunit N (RpoN/RPB10)
LVRCTCGSILSRPELVEAFITLARQPAQNIADKRDQKLEDLRKRNDLTTRQKIKELEQIQVDGKIEMQRELRRVFDSLRIRKICCRVQISDYARRGLTNETVEDPETGEEMTIPMVFDAEKYYQVE